MLFILTSIDVKRFFGIIDLSTYGSIVFIMILSFPYNYPGNGSKSVSYLIFLKLSCAILIKLSLHIAQPCHFSITLSNTLYQCP